jgi:hypothetical protein
MFAVLSLVLAVLAVPFKSKRRLEAENAALRHQVMVLRRQVRGRIHLTNFDRLFLVQLYRWCPSILRALVIIEPETVVRWHRAGFRCYWRWKSRLRGGRPQISAELRALIRRMSIENPLWGAPRIHGELSSGLRSRSRASPSTWSSGMVCRARGGAPSCAATRPTLLPWTCSLSQPLASTCSMPWLLSVWAAETWSGSTPQRTQPRNGLHGRSPKRSLGMRPRVT